MAEDLQFAVVESATLEWPTSLRLSSRRFRLFVAADATGLSNQEISDFAYAALSAGVVYFCAWGQGAERFHDLIDAVIVKDILGERQFALSTPDDVIMTTWHQHETLEEALDFFAACAVPTEGYLADSRCWLVICIGNPEWASVATRFLAAVDYFE
jgi:hypothetical protein